MAYRRATTRRRSTSAARGGYRSSARRKTRAPARKRVSTRTRSAPRQQVLKIVFENAPANSLARPAGDGTVVKGPTGKAKF
jgi:hypothetical protein